MSGFCHYIYCLQEESTHFGLRASTNLVWKYPHFLGTKNSYKKNHENSLIFFELNQTFIHNFLSQSCANVPIIYDAYIKNQLNYFSLIKNCFISFFLIFWYAPIPPSCGMPCCRH